MHRYKNERHTHNPNAHIGEKKVRDRDKERENIYNRMCLPRTPTTNEKQLHC